MNIYQLEDYDVQGVDAGSKARIDVCQILHEQGIEALLYHYEKSRMKRLLESIKLTFIKKKDKRLIVQYPISRWNQKILRRSKGQGIIYLIHDLQSIRCGRLLNTLPAALKGSFGLIWDGDDLNGCRGLNGEYMRYNNPHKLSLYIVSLLPIITWSKAAIAPFVIQHNIGFVVDSLTEIEGRILTMHSSTYQLYVDNLLRLRDKLLMGMYTKQAITKALHVYE